MKTLAQKKSLFAWFLVLLIPMAPRGVSAIENFESLKVLTMELPAYPLNLTSEGIYDGSARIVVNVNEKGELEDVYLESYTHPVFGRLAEQYVKKWTFQPAKLNGEPLSVIKPFDFWFEDKRGVYAMGMQEAVAAKLNFARHSESKRIYSPKELDEIPVPISMVTPLFPAEFKGQYITGSATVVFYIDETGTIRMPHLTDYSHEDFGRTALMAVNEWKFEAPKIRGKPVSIMVRQKFTFTESKK